MSPERKATILEMLKGSMTAEQAADALGISVRAARDAGRRYLKSKLPTIDGEVLAPIDSPVEILRDAWGVPHITGSSLYDVYFGLGYAMGQDRLWQLDYMRRLGNGRLAEVLGPKFLLHDRLHRTIGLKSSSEEAVNTAPDEVVLVLNGLGEGINAAIAEASDNLGVEFELLLYEPDPWTAADSVAVWKWRWWMLTGRLGVLAISEAAKQHLEGDLLEAFMSAEAGEETIVPSDRPAEQGGFDVGEGSNNWAVGRSLCKNGGPVLATDPHNGVELSRQWYQAQITAPGIDAVGAFFLGTPGIYLGHNRHASWGVTNHTASARDIYRETISPDNPGMYLDSDNEWHALEETDEEIPVRGQSPDKLKIRRTTRGPIVNEFVPSVDHGGSGSLSLRWEGVEATTGFESMLALIRSTSVDDVLGALGDWPFPILNFVFADSAGRVGYHAAGRVPRRDVEVKGYRDGVNADHDWNGHYAFDEMPNHVDPDTDWVASANNPPWGGKNDYLGLGNWSDGYRYRRIRQRITDDGPHDIDSVGAIHADVIHGRAEDLAGKVAALLESATTREIRDAGEMLAAWDGRYTVDEIAPTIFTAFWEAWLERIAAERFPERLVSLVKGRGAAVARRLIEGKDPGWFRDPTDIATQVRTTMGRALHRLKTSAGPRKSQWRWGKLHTITFGHPVAETPALRALFEVGPEETPGTLGTVRAAGYSTGKPFEVTGISTYRMVVDMADPAHGKATSSGGQSGHPASPHYRTQTDLWLKDDYHPLLMDRADIERALEGKLVLIPG